MGILHVGKYVYLLGEWCEGTIKIEKVDKVARVKDVINVYNKGKVVGSTEMLSYKGGRSLLKFENGQEFMKLWREWMSKKLVKIILNNGKWSRVYVSVDILIMYMYIYVYICVCIHKHLCYECKNINIYTCMHIKLNTPQKSF